MNRDDAAVRAAMQSELERMTSLKTTAPSAPAEPMSWWQMLREDVSCVLERDPAARSRFEVWTIYPGVHAVAVQRMAHALWVRGWRFLPRWMSFMARWLTNIDIHPGASIGRRFFIDHGACVVIGETAEIGSDVTLYHGVTLGGTSWSPGKRHPTLGDGVVVGAGAKILGPIKVGDRARVAANSVVIEPVPEGATVVGIPGRVVVRRHAKAAGGTGVEQVIDLDHHLIPDPVGKAIACLLDRISALEVELSAIRPSAPALVAAKETDQCQSCDAVCAPQPSVSSHLASTATSGATGEISC